MPRPRIHSHPQQDQQLRSTQQSHQMYCSSTGRWSRTMQFRLVRERICNTGEIDTEGIRVCTETQHQDEQYDLSCLAPPEGRKTDISFEEVVRRSVSARCPDTPNALQGKVAAVLLRWSHGPPGRRRGPQKQMGGDFGFSPERHTDTHGRSCEQRGRQPQTPRGRQTGHNPQGERTHSEEIYRLVDFWPTKSRSPRRYATPLVGIPSGETFRTVYAWRLEEHSPGSGFHGRHRSSRSETRSSSTLQHPPQGAPVEHPYRRKPETGAAVPDSHGPSARRHSR